MAAAHPKAVEASIDASDSTQPGMQHPGRALHPSRTIGHTVLRRCWRHAGLGRVFCILSRHVSTRVFQALNRSIFFVLTTSWRRLWLVPMFVCAMAGVKAPKQAPRLATLPKCPNQILHPPSRSPHASTLAWARSTLTWEASQCDHGFRLEGVGHCPSWSRRSPPCMTNGPSTHAPRSARKEDLKWACMRWPHRPRAATTTPCFERPAQVRES